jgi:hypothetical protein
MAPEAELRRLGAYAQADLRELLADCVRATEAFLADPDPQPAPPRPERSYTATHTGTDWVMATSEAGVFDLVYEAGHTRAVLWQPLPDGSTAYTVGRKSDLVDGFPVGPPSRPETILAALAGREPGWGGGSSIGGAPRHPDGSRSRLSPDEVFAVVEEAVTALSGS